MELLSAQTGYCNESIALIKDYEVVQCTVSHASYPLAGQDIRGDRHCQKLHECPVWHFWHWTGQHHLLGTHRTPVNNQSKHSSQGAT